MDDTSGSRRWQRDIGRVVLFWSGALLILIVFGFVRGMLPPGAGPLAWGIGSSLALVVLIRAFLRADRRPLADAGLGWHRRSPIRLAAGFAFGVVAYAGAVALASLAVGPIRVRIAESPSAGMIVLAVAGTIALVIMEELALRSYSLWTAVRAVGSVPAQLLVAVAFALLHVGYGWPLQTVLLGVLPSALLFGVGAVITGGLAMPIGIHLGMNIGRWAAGERGAAGLLVLESGGSDPARAALAPYFAALAPLGVAALLYVVGRRRGTADG
jgi:uncharacterized protein